MKLFDRLGRHLNYNRRPGMSKFSSEKPTSRDGKTFSISCRVTMHMCTDILEQK